MDSEDLTTTEPLNITLEPVPLQESLKKPNKAHRAKSVYNRLKKKKNGPAPGSSNSNLQDLPPEEWKQIENLAKIRAPLREIAAKHDITPEKLKRMIEDRYRMPLSQWLDSKHDYARLFLRAKAWEMATDGKHPILTMVHLFNMLPEEFKDVKQIVHKREDNGESAKAIEALTKLFKRIDTTQQKYKEIFPNNNTIQDAEIIQPEQQPNNTNNNIPLLDTSQPTNIIELPMINRQENIPEIGNNVRPDHYNA